MTFALWPVLLLLLPAALLLWRLRGPGALLLALRATLVAALVLALADPRLRWRDEGADVVVVVDRSRSMPPGSDARALELVQGLEKARRPEDRVGVVTFGEDVRVERPPSGERFGGFTQPLRSEGSNLGGALEAAAQLVGSGRSGRVLLLSDGLATDAEVLAAGRRLGAQGIPVDFRWLGRPAPKTDAAVLSLDTPSAVAVREPFMLTARVFSRAAAKAKVTLTRDGQPLVRGELPLAAGSQLLTFRDLVEQPGLASYALRLSVEGDELPQNDVGRAVTRVEAPPRALLVTRAPKGVLAQVLAANLDALVRPPEPLTLAGLEGVSTVVLEDVEAGALGEEGLHVLAQFVKEAGGGLVMTGGKRSFGAGGYRKSPVEEVLPVSLELRAEQRDVALAMAVVMDCSCSMGVQVPDGRTKMELAAEGVVGALELLNPSDEASVDLIDTERKSLIPLSPVKEGLPLYRVQSAYSGGGGIYIGEALRTARQEISKSSKATRHVLLFADAADSENPDDYKETLAKLARERVTVSVIAMGSPKDADAKLLEEVASLGRGRLYFAEDARSLPRVFSEETIAIARVAFLSEPTPVGVGGDLPLLGPVSAPAAALGGYNVTYLKPQAGLGLRTKDANTAPVLAFWRRGAGRALAYTGEVDGEATGAVRDWAGYRGLLEKAVRWTMERPAGAVTPGVARVVRRGSEVQVSVDYAPGQVPAAPPRLTLLSSDGRGAPLSLPMRSDGEGRYVATHRLASTDTLFPVIQSGDGVLRAPPVILPYAPEFEPRADDGAKTLRELAEASGGVERLSLSGLFEASARSERWLSLSPWLTVAALLLLLAEVFVRRSGAGSRAVQAAQGETASESPMAPAAAPPPEVPSPSALDRARERARRRF